MTDPLRPLSPSEIQPYASRGNAFGRLEDARAVARSRPGEEVIAKEGAHYVLHARQDSTALSNLASSSSRVLLEFVDSGNRVLNLDNELGIRGVGQLLGEAELAGKAARGNAFSRYTHAEAVARTLPQPTAIVARDGGFQLFALSSDSAARLRAGSNDLLDARVTAVVSKGKTLYNWGADRAADSPRPGFAYAAGGKLMLDHKPYTIRGMNVYNLAEVAARGDGELRRTLQLLADTGVNTVRFWAFSKHSPESVARILDTAKEMKLELKFIPVLGNHWKHVEAAHSEFDKGPDWYSGGFEQHYWPHAERMVGALIDRPEILMWELMNEPEGPHAAVRGFADEVSTRIRGLYDRHQAESGGQTPRHLIGLGTLGLGRHGDERPGMQGHEYKDLYGLPHIDVATVHDYTSATLEGSIADFMGYARDLNKPFFLGEIGVKLRQGGTETQPELGPIDRALGYDADAARSRSLARVQEKILASQTAGSAGAMLWGPQPNGQAVDGDGFGFSYAPAGKAFDELRQLFGSW